MHAIKKEKERSTKKQKFSLTEHKRSLKKRAYLSLIMHSSLQSWNYEFVFQHLKFLFYWSRSGNKWRKYQEMFEINPTKSLFSSDEIAILILQRCCSPLLSPPFKDNSNSNHLKNRNFLMKFSWTKYRTKSCFW